MGSPSGGSDNSREQAQADSSDKPDRGGFTTSLGAVLGIATTTVVAVFAALGVSGNLLARMVRNDPDSIRWILFFAIIAVLVAAVVTAFRSLPTEWIVLPVIGLGVVLIIAANAATDSQRKRENPAISLSLTRSQSRLTLTAKATASSLRSNDRMLLRVAAILRPLGVKELPGSTTTDRTTELRKVTNEECKRAELHPLHPKDARLLSWTETGANVSGEASTEQTMPVPSKAQYVCAWAILSALPTDPRENAPEDFALIDLAGMRSS
jgi:hypothetical protein